MFLSQTLEPESKQAVLELNPPSEAVRQLQQHLVELREAPQEKQRRRSRRLQKKETEEAPPPPLPVEVPRHSPRKRSGRHARHSQERPGPQDSAVSDSQVMQVTYDDPDGRRERAKLMAIIERYNGL